VPLQVWEHDGRSHWAVAKWTFQELRMPRAFRSEPGRATVRRAESFTTRRTQGRSKPNQEMENNAAHLDLSVPLRGD
jgi:hypothetical protein